jgi:hypothetical protein
VAVRGRSLVCQRVARHVVGANPRGRDGGVLVPAMERGGPGNSLEQGVERAGGAG